MFAGPNGSGKSTLKELLPSGLIGVYINPDDIERNLRVRGFIDLAEYKVEATQEELRTFFRSSTLLARANLTLVAEAIDCISGRLSIDEGRSGAYVASVASDFIRRRLLREQISFTFETVMSSPDKVQLLRHAQKLGYRTYLYYIATEDPAINISRVALRVSLGGHGVPEDKVISRYKRSLDLLPDAIRSTNRAFIFDNSSWAEERTWIAAVTDGVNIEMKTERVPNWFDHAVLARLEDTE